MPERPPLSPYPDPEDRERLLDRLTARCGGEVIAFGESLEGRPLRAARIPGERTGAPRLLCTANIHGPEYIASQLALGLLERLALPEGDLATLHARAELWLIPCLNPDGYARTWQRQGRGRLAELRPNADGVDLNRNFPLPGGARPSRLPGAGSTKAGAITYRGPAPLSEPESAALDALLRSQRFFASANLHSYMGTVIPARVQKRAEYQAYRQLCRALRRAQSSVRYLRLASRWLDVYTGELEDHQHHGLDCWAICLESFTVRASLSQHLRAPALFWRFNPHDPRPWVQNDLPGLVAYYLAALELEAPSQLERG